MSILPERTGTKVEQRAHSTERKRTMTTALKQSRKRVNLELTGKPASDVFVAGSFNDWDPTAKPLKPVGGNGQYRATLMLPQGRHEYKFVVDGAWHIDPQNPDVVANDRGSQNSILVVQ